MIVIIKPTNSCNAGCVYCSAHSNAHDTHVMSKTTLETVFREFAGHLAGNPDEHVVWTWHGGEPLLAGKGFYRQVLALQQEYFPGYADRMKNLIQTNLTLIDEEWLDILDELCGESGIGTSYDPIVGIRPLNGDKQYETAWNRAIGLLEDRGMKFGIGYVVHKRALGREAELYRYFSNFGTRVSVRYNPLYEMGRGSSTDSAIHWISPAEYGESLVSLYELWEADDRIQEILPVSEWVDLLEGKKKRLTCDSSGRCYRTHLGVGPNGNVYCCGRGHDAQTVLFGNIESDSLDEILHRRSTSDIARRYEALLKSDCRDCDIWDWCHGGCPIDGFAHNGTVLSKTHWCESRKIFSEYYMSRNPDHARRRDESCGATVTRKKSRDPGQTRQQRYHIRVPFPLLEDLLSSPICSDSRHRLSVEVTESEQFDDLARVLGSPNGHQWSVVVRYPTPLPSGDRYPARFQVDCTHEAIDLRTIAAYTHPNSRRPPFFLDASRAGVGDATLMLASLGVPVRLVFRDPRELQTGDLQTILDYYLFSKSLRVPIEPVHLIIQQVLQNAPLDLWQVLGEDPERALFIGGDGQISLSERFHRADRNHGPIDMELGDIPNSPLYRSVRESKMHHRTHFTACSVCRVFPLCSGFFVAADDGLEARDCEPVVAFLSDVIASAELARGLLEGRDAQDGTP